jgi:hypothetical protein
MESIEAVKPWAGPDAWNAYRQQIQGTIRHASDAAGGDGKRFVERIRADGKLERMRIIYRMLKDNYSVTGKELKEAIGISRQSSKLVFESINTLDDFLPIWQEQDDMDHRIVWFGLLDRSKIIPELETD